MPRPHHWGIAASLMMLIVSGCQSAPSMVRGQSPPDGSGYSGPGQYDYGAGAADPNCDPNCRGRGGLSANRQYYRSTYKVPGKLAYPPPNAPPAVVQYPYYTVKGPDCFFYTGE